MAEEVFDDTWDALSAASSGLIIGVAAPACDNGFNTYEMGDTAIIFAVAKNHPLCREQQPLSNQLIKKYPAVVVADSSR